MRPQDLEAFVEELSPDLLRYFARRVSDPADAADLLGDTLLVLCRRSRSVPDDPAQARLWAYGVARRTLAGRRRATRRRTALQERLREQLAADGNAGETGDDRLRAALERLDPVDREIIRLLHWDGFSQVEVASILGKPAGTVRSRYTRARAALRTALSDLQESDRGRP